MGECILNAGRQIYFKSSGGSSVSAPPVLDSINPIDGEIKATESILLSVFVEENNIDCTYQWFINDNIISGANESTFEYVPEDVYATNIIKCAVSNSKGTTYSREASILVWPTRWNIIKNSAFVDSTAKFTNPFGSAIKVSGTKISTTQASGGNRYVTLDLSEAVLSRYVSSFYTSYTTNSNYKPSYSIEAYTNWDNDDLYIVRNNTKLDMHRRVPLERILIFILSKTEGSNAYIQINELYLE